MSIPRWMRASSSGVGMMNLLDAAFISFYLSLVGTAQTDDAPCIVSAREHHAKYSTVERPIADFPDLTIIAAFIDPIHEFIPIDLASEIKRKIMLDTIHRIFNRIKRYLDVHSLWTPKGKLKRREFPG
jgi:hypothetical protein